MATPLPQDRLVRKEVALGTIREYQPPQDHIGLASIAPFESVASDDVIFTYTRGLTVGMSPARAEDAESEMAGKDDSTSTGRASVIDWAIKDHYDASDIQRWREFLLIQDVANVTQLPLTVQGALDEWQRKLARDELRRRRMHDNRLEWLIMTALETGSITYNDGRIVFTVSFGRPGGQQDMAPPSGALWSNATTADPIEDLLTIQQSAFDTYGVRLNKGILSRKLFRYLRKSQKFVVVGGPVGANKVYVDPNWSDQAALEYVQTATGIQFTIYDSVYRTRPLGSNTVTNTRFVSDNKVILLPDPGDVSQYDDAIGFAKTLTSPHPEGNWTSGYYEWERSTVDPWGYDVGTGIKAFPVFPHLDMSYVIAAA
jgi:hypothetical protein